MRPDFSPAHSPLIPAVWAPVLAPLSRPPEDVAGGPAPPPSYTPALKFNDARNGQYLLLFPWLGMTPTAQPSS